MPREPNPHASALIEAIDKALAGDWDSAHGIVQRHDDDAAACRLHAILHKIEGDAANSRYWYARSGGHGYEDFDDARVELDALRASLTA